MQKLKLLTAQQVRRLAANGLKKVENPDFDPKPVALLFDPHGPGFFMLAALFEGEFEQEIFYCLHNDLGHSKPKIGYVNGGKIISCDAKRDRFFKPRMTIREYLEYFTNDGVVLAAISAKF